MSNRQSEPSKWDRLDWLKANEPAPATRAARAAPAVVMQHSPRVIELPYAPPIGKLLLGAIFFGICAMFIAERARSNDAELIINGIIHLSVANATRFYWGLTLLSGGFVAACLVFGLPQVFIRRRIVLADDAITYPGWGFSRKHYTVPARKIRAASVSTYSGNRFITIRTDVGKFTVNGMWLPSEGDADTIIDWLKTRTGLGG
jgi:hypothetical protein